MCHFIKEQNKYNPHSRTAKSEFSELNYSEGQPHAQNWIHHVEEIDWPAMKIELWIWSV
jgi:hypothetical protein